MLHNSKKPLKWWESSILRLTVPQEEDEVLGLVEIRLNIQGSVKSLPPFVVPVAGMQLFLFGEERDSERVSSKSRSGLLL